MTWMIDDPFSARSLQGHLKVWIPNIFSLDQSVGVLICFRTKQFQASVITCDLILKSTLRMRKTDRELSGSGREGVVRKSQDMKMRSEHLDRSVDS